MVNVLTEEIKMKITEINKLEADIELMLRSGTEIQ